MRIAAAAANALFALCYIFFVRKFLAGNNSALVYPVYIAPAVIYGFITLAAYASGRITGYGFKKNWAVFSTALFAFVILAACTVINRINFPEPHNFFSRKMEILLGGSYSVFVIALASLFLKNIAGHFVSGYPDRGKVFKFILVFFFSFYFAMSLWLNYANEPTGDEPAYLLTAHSILYDRDLDLKNNFNNKDYRRFYSRELQPQGSDIIRGGKIFSYHPAFFSLIIAPFYFLAGRLGCTILMNIFSAVFIALIFYLLSRLFDDTKIAVVAALITGFSMPVLGLTNSIAADIISGMLLTAAYIILKYHREKTALFSILMGLIVWVHIRSAPVFAGLALLYFYYSRKEIKKIAIFSAAQLFSLAMFLAFNYICYGVIVPSYAEKNQTTADLMSTNIFLGGSALLLDRQLGLFTYAPVFVLIIAGIIFMAKKHRVILLESGIILLPYFALISSWYNLGGGTSSPRYLVPVIFVFSIMLASALKEIRAGSGQFRLAGALSSWGFLLSGILCFIPWFRWDRPYNENPLLTMAVKIAHMDLMGFFPSFRVAGGNNIILFLVWTSIILAVNAYFIYAGKKTEEKQ